MIAFGCSVGEPEEYLRYAKPGIVHAAEPDSIVHVFAAVESITRSYNILLDAAAALDGLEAMVLVQPTVRITDDGFAAKVRAALADSQVAVVGVAGASGVQTIAWWEGTVSASSSLVVSDSEDPKRAFTGIPWVPNRPAPAEVDAVDGFLLILSPWAVRNVRFDETLTLHHGYDIDYCFQARVAGRKVMTSELAVFERRALDIVTNVDLWSAAHADFGRKWSGRIPGPEASAWDPKRRARRAEAERESARSISFFKRLSYEAQVAALERQLHELESSLSIRVTKPLRQVNQWRQRSG